MSSSIACNDDELAALAAKLGDDVAGTLCAKLANTEGGLNMELLLFAGALVFIMHGGFAMLCAGAIRSKNTMNILLQTILDAAVSAIAFYTLGYAFAWGTPPYCNGFIGYNMFGLQGFAETTQPSLQTGTWTDWFFQWAFAATATTIPAGAVAERFNFNAYLGYSFFIAAWVYPVVVHWAWSGCGWMSAFNTTDTLLKVGYMDFAGSGVVHMVGGFAGLVGCYMVGPRLGRFDSNGNPVDMPGHSATLVVLGTVLLWFGWYGFNPGSVLAIGNTGYQAVSGRAACTTTLSGAAGGLAGLVISFGRHKAWDLLSVCNGVLVGFVSITAGCHVVEPWAAILAGIIGVAIFEAVCVLFLKLRIDDPLSASPMHGFGGIWGVLFVGLLANPEYISQVYGDKPYWGAFYPGGGGNLFACQLIGVLVILGWTVANMALFFLGFKLTNTLRISPEEEQAGLDVSKHGGSAYNADHGLPGKPSGGNHL